jgi:hypothetical protein
MLDHSDTLAGTLFKSNPPKRRRKDKKMSVQKIYTNTNCADCGGRITKHSPARNCDKDGCGNVLHPDCGTRQPNGEMWCKECKTDESYGS